MLEITATQRRALRARAHALKPVVLISQNGLTDAVMKEIGVDINTDSSSEQRNDTPSVASM